MSSARKPTTAADVLDECCRSTDEQQRIAYRELYRPIIWPATFEAAMLSKPFRVAICAVARNRGRVHLRDVARPLTTLPQGPVPDTPSIQPQGPYARSPYSKATGPVMQLGAWPTKLTLDVKKLAANDKDEA